MTVEAALQKCLDTLREYGDKDRWNVREDSAGYLIHWGLGPEPAQQALQPPTPMKQPHRRQSTTKSTSSSPNAWKS